MNLTTSIKQQLAHLAQRDWAPGDTYSLTADATHGTLECQLVRVDKLACEFQSLVMQTTRFSGAGPDELRKVGENLSERLRYLLEPICPIEIDLNSATLQMRSSPPSQDDDGHNYYELCVGREGLRLTRYRKQVGNARQVVPACVTHEVLCRLARDFDDVLA